MPDRTHRNEAAYPALWRAVAGGLADAQNAHSDIQIPQQRAASIVKRIVGQVLALQCAGVGQPTEMAAGALRDPAASGAHRNGLAGEGQFSALPQPDALEKDTSHA